MPWKHPEFGEFEYDRLRGWGRSVSLPGFAVFTWPANGDRPPGHCDLYFQTGDENVVPSEAAVAIASKLLNEQRQLANAITVALWEDFNGRGPNSGMWWHGHLEKIDDMYDSGLPAITNPDALFAWMHLDGIDVRNSGARSEEHPIVELTFSAPFEVEHGVGILTDGVTILGTGYAGDVDPFRS
jgi:hypothetical protein